MDISKLLKNVNNVDDYISATEKILSDLSNSKIYFNMSTVIALKKIRSIEIEYFTKCEENGAALKIFELILQTPSSKAWSLLGKELILLIQYWLDAIRKHIILHTISWWNFLSVLLKFIKKISTKHLELINILIEENMEGLLDLATQSLPDVNQKFKIIHCINSFCDKSSKQIRLAFREKFEYYFVKLSSQMALCGDIRTQYCIMETLLRWLLPRHDPTVRRDACVKWFPLTLYNNNANDIFMKQHWLHFFKDAREFLNAHNETSDLVTSFLCNRFSIGNVTLISDKDKINNYVDINCGSKNISLMLDPNMQDILCSPRTACDAIVIQEDNTENVQLYRKFLETVISVKVVDPSKMHSLINLQECDVTLLISSTSNLKRIDKALRNIFNTKYQLLIDIDDQTNVSTCQKETRQYNDSEEDTKSSRPVEIQRKKHSGYISRKKHLVSSQSPSTASTSSLGLLKEKLTTLPGFRFNKEPTTLYAVPDLSRVTEVTESEENIASNTQSTPKLNTFGACNRKVKENDKIKSHIDISKEQNQCRSAINNDYKNSVSQLPVVTIDSADVSVINDKIERLPKNKEINTEHVIDLLTREALQFQSSTEVYENTPNILNVPIGRVAKTVCEEIEKNNTDKQTYDKQAVESVSQHFVENRHSDIFISTTLARKINETSSESREPFERPITNNDIKCNFNEIVKGHNDIVDKVCKDIYSELSNDNLDAYENEVTEVDSQTPLNKVTNSDIKKHNTQSKKKTPKIKMKDIKLGFKKAKSNRKNVNKLDIESFNRISPIKNRENVLKRKSSKIQINPNKFEKEYEIPLTRRKRKLYSSKDVTKVNEEVGIHISETEEDTVPSVFKFYDKTPKSLVTSYKEIDITPKDSVRRTRNKSLLRESVSPRTKKMNDLFDNVIKSEDGQENITLADGKTKNKKLLIYDFCNDSEEKIESFKLKKPFKKSSISTFTRYSKRLNKAKNSKNKLTDTDNVNNNNTKPKTVRTRANKKKLDLKSRSNLEDQCMRDAAAEVLNTSLVIGEPRDNINEVDPAIKEPEMETIVFEVRKNKKNRKKDLSLKKRNIDNKIEKHSDQDSESPLPVLIVEKAQVHREDDDNSIKSVLLDNLKDITEFNTTLNLLDNIETNNRSPPKLNVTCENNKINRKTDTPKQNKSANTKSKAKRNKAQKLSNDSKEMIKNKSKTKGKETKARKLSIVSYESNEDEIIKDNSSKTIATVGRSPITARGGLEGSPPNTVQLNQPIKPRNLYIESQNKSTQAYYENLTQELNTSLRSRNKFSSTNVVNGNTNNDSPERLKTIVLDKSPTVSIVRLSTQEMKKWEPTVINSIFGSSVTSKTSFRITRSQSKNSRNEIDSKPTESMQIHKSSISPVRMVIERDNVNSNSSQSDSYVNHIRGTMTRKILTSLSPKSLKSSKNDENIRKDDKSSTISEENTKISSKRKASSSIKSVAKLKKVNSKSSSGNITSEVSVGSYSTQKWLQRNDVENLVDAEGLAQSDHLQQIMEKLNTTLAEIHHATSTKFVNMFIDAINHLNEMKADRHRLYRETARATLADIVKITDRNFADLDKSCQERDDQFIENIKQKFQEFIREDYKQKKAMVMLLQEDIKQTENKNN